SSLGTDAILMILAALNHVAHNVRSPNRAASLELLRTINLRSVARTLSADCLKMPRVGQLTSALRGLRIKNTVPFSETLFGRLMQGHERPRQRNRNLALLLPASAGDQQCRRDPAYRQAQELD